MAMTRQPRVMLYQRSLLLGCAPGHSSYGCSPWQTSECSPLLALQTVLYSLLSPKPYSYCSRLRGAGRGSRYVLNGLRTNALDVPDTNRKSREALAYYNSFSPSLSEQSRSCSGLAASLLQRNFVAVTLELEREAEWQNTDLDPTVREWLAELCVASPVTYTYRHACALSCTHTQAQRAQKRAAVAQLKRDAFSDAATGGGAAIPGTSAAAGDTSGGLQDVLDGYRQGKRARLARVSAIPTALPYSLWCCP